MKKRTVTLSVSVAALALIAVSCGSKSSSTTTAAPETTAAAVETSAAPETTAVTETTAAMSATALKDAGCPDPMVIQTDWFPEADHGWTYQLIGPNGTQDPKKGSYTGQVAGITLDIRAGGPAIGFASPAKQMYQDPSVWAAYVDTGDAIRNATTQPVVAVFASYEKSPQMIQWDPVKYPDVKTIADVGAAAGDGQIRVFEGAAYIDYLVGKGIWKASQVDTSYDGSPSLFVSKGDLFQQGYATAEIYAYQNLIDGWKKPIATALTYDAGFSIYQSAFSVKPESITKDAACLKVFVPMAQKAVVDYMADPKAVNDMLAGYGMAMNWTESSEGNAAATATMKEQGLVGDGITPIVGDMDCERIQKLIDEFNPIEKAANVEGVKDGLQCAEIIDNQFIDPSISLGF
ncbi:MAG: ABC transporter substrate-binding protein [Actinobacteria bacterium]|uniref:Unannotated protein n=2 Tax=freshwater metagenome TaxID=449393 RepID=A0A6J6YF30_9ZZZZ|nr:ABC transporter substrate-binding protein [Actinomycetota bacterium]